MSKQVDRWWLSFVGEEGFKGGALVRAESLFDAVIKTHTLGINPGGQVMGVPVDRDDPGPFEENRLYSKKEINRLDKAVEIGEQDSR